MYLTKFKKNQQVSISYDALSTIKGSVFTQKEKKHGPYP